MKRLLQRFVPLLGCLAFGALTTAAAERTVGTSPSFKGPVGLQLYSLRADFAKDVPGTLQKVRDLGFRYVELAGTYNLTPEQFKEALDVHGLTAVAGHFPYDRFRDDPAGIARDAKTLGLHYAGCAWITHEGRFNEQQCRAAAAVFNRAGELLAKDGVKFYYHTHGYEFQPFANGTLFDLLLKETNPRYVRYQMDLLWIVHPGHNPVALLNLYPQRFELMHLKDLKKGVEGDLTGHTDVTNDVILGTGQMDLPAILKAAQKAKVKWYFIEDESPTAARQIPESLKYLESLDF